MAGLQFVDFALMPGPEGKKSNSEYYDFSKIDVAIPSRTNHPAVFHDTTVLVLQNSCLSLRFRFFA